MQIYSRFSIHNRNIVVQLVIQENIEMLILGCEAMILENHNDVNESEILFNDGIMTSCIDYMNTSQRNILIILYKKRRLMLHGDRLDVAWQEPRNIKKQ